MLGAAGQIPDTCTASQISDAVKHCRTASDKQGKDWTQYQSLKELGFVWETE